jgi:hypothetical protein
MATSSAGLSNSCVADLGGWTLVQLCSLVKRQQSGLLNAAQQALPTSAGHRARVKRSEDAALEWF